jgi:hypothetical protein
MRKVGLLLPLLAACSDYNLSDKGEGNTGDGPDEPAPGDVDVSPGSVDAGILCAEGSAAVAVTNRGDGDLTLTGLSTSTGAWTAESGLVPATLAPGESLEVGLSGGPGDDTLLVETDDPDEPTVSVPITSAPDAAPSLVITAPSGGDVLPASGDVDLVAEVADDVDPDTALSVVWETDAAGGIGAAAGDGTGVSTLAWAAADRPSGPQTLTATLTDACDNTVSQSVEVCGQAGYDADNLDLSSWTFEGGASWDATNGWVQLTPNTTYQVGSAFQTGTATTGDNVTVAFRFYMGDGTGADGFAITALDTDRMTGTLGSAGGCLGYGYGAGCEPLQLALPGWTIEVDTFYNASWDPTQDDHVAFMFDGNPAAVEAWSALPEMEDTGWHTMEITVAAPRVTVSIDGTVYIDQDIPGFYAFPAYVGFSAATGGQTNLHLIDALTVTEYVCDEGG